MVMWDLTFDPRASTIQHMWIWEQGGGYFGVPLTNYLGWFFTVYVFLQLFALLVRLRPGTDEARETLPRSYFAQAVVMYAVVGLTPVLTYLVGVTNSPVTDAAGLVWQTASIAESAATVSIFTMIFGVALAAVKLIQAPAAAVQKSVSAETAVKRDLLTAN
jgi:putative membrane protein